MEVSDLIGRRVCDVHQLVKSNSLNGWLDEGDVWLTLDDGIVIGMPYALEGAVHVRTLPAEARSIFPEERPMVLGYRRFWKFWLPFSKPTEWDFRELLGQEIVDLISVGDDRCAYVVLANGNMVSMNSVAPNGTGSAGVELVRSLSEFETRWGNEMKRLAH